MTAIREITRADIPQCVSVIRESFRTVARDFGFTERNAPRFTAFAVTEDRLSWQIDMEHRPMYGCFEGGELVGYYSLLLQSGGECELNNLCVLPSRRHKGLGDELLEDAFDNARRMECVKMNIGIVEENRVLRKWYEDHGFVHTCTKKYDFFPFTCGYMVRDLT